ncbi:hypothetical protein GZ22_18155 (plasmid) [Terribacillus saccharophilus]|uniref:YdbS-like PH domain-containing protein n=1 Tax=Terribacillus saccharophilus TaxID=361277 RepID=A0A075LQG5_9BACI|nr:PH domain-containing protein [Terribacillus goriensis]AIF68366.1 hypothetical protein GZ22_18155 [Terribacillus goriensis]
MNITLKEPSKKISPLAIKYWRLVDVIVYSILFGILGILYFLSSKYNWSDWWDTVFILGAVLLVLSFIIEFFYVPKYKQKTWRYEITENSIQLKYGRLLKKSYKIIPMNKVYYVNTYQHPLLKRYNLSTLKIGTIAYVHEIPALPEQEAQHIRQLISDLSGISLTNSNEEERHIDG